MCFLMALIKSCAENETRFLPSPFLISTSRFLILAKAFRKDHVAACSTALRNATERSERGGWLRNRSMFVQNDIA